MKIDQQLIGQALQADLHDGPHRLVGAPLAHGWVDKVPPLALLVFSDMDVHFCPTGALCRQKDATILAVKCSSCQKPQGK